MLCFFCDTIYNTFIYKSMSESYLKLKIKDSLLTKEQRLHLIHGAVMIDNANCSFFRRHSIPDFPFESEAHRRYLWDENKERLLSEIWEKSFYDNGFYYFENQFIGETPFPDAFYEYEKCLSRSGNKLDK